MSYFRVMESLKYRRNLFGMTSDNRYSVRIANSWEQPQCNPNKKIKLDEENDVKNVPTNGILQLNDDCLLHIMSFLSLEDKINLSKVNSRMENVCRMSIQKFDTSEQSGSTLMQIQNFLLTFGEHLTHIRVSSHDLDTSIGKKSKQKLYQLILEHCTKLQHFTFFGSYTSEIDDIIKKYEKQLKSISIGSREFNASTRCYENILNCVNLQMLCFNYSQITGQHLSNLSNLTVLQLRGCKKFQFNNFLTLCTKNQFEVLDIAECDLLNINALDIIEKHQNKLVTLAISSEQLRFDEKPPNFHNLKNLFIVLNKNEEMNGTFLKNLILKCSQQNFENLYLVIKSFYFYVAKIIKRGKYDNITVLPNNLRSLINFGEEYWIGISFKGIS